MHRMKCLWTFNTRNKLKIRAFKATIETVLLYGSKCCTLDSKLKKLIDGCYTRLLRMYQNSSWKSKASNEKLYNGSPKATNIISERMLNLAGPCIRHKEEMAHNLIICTHTHTHEEKEEEVVGSLSLYRLYKFRLGLSTSMKYNM